MKLLKFILLALIVFIVNINLYAQDDAATPEYEATKQTEKLQQELNLSTNQVKQVYDINLKYARARQASVSRSEAMERMKNKDADLHRVLSNEQINRLQNKRYERSSFQSIKPAAFRSSGESTHSGTSNRSTSEEESKIQTRRSNSEMQTNSNTTNRNSDVQPGRVTPQSNYQRSATPSTRISTPSTRTTTPSTRTTTPSTRSTIPSSPQKSTESKRVETNPSGSQRR